jgi:hypothetical protein
MTGLREPVQKLLKQSLVGTLQRPENKQWCGFQPGPFRYNEGPTSSCHTFCWKARHPLGRAYFFALPRPGA